MSIGRNAIRVSLTGVLAAHYTVPPAKRFEIRSITGVNQDATDSSWEVYLAPAGVAAGNSNILVPPTTEWEIPAGYNIDYETWKVLDEGGKIWAKTGGTLVTLHIDGALVDK